MFVLYKIFLNLSFLQAFKHCTQLLRIKIPAFVEKIGKHTFSQANGLGSVIFEGNSVLIDIGDLVSKNKYLIFVCHTYSH